MGRIPVALIIGTFFISTFFTLPTHTGAAEYKRLIVQNMTGNIVNCPEVKLIVKVNTGSTKSGNRPNKSWRPGDTRSFRLGDSTGCEHFSVALTCVSLLDGWPRKLSLSSGQCRDIQAYFQINDKGELILSGTP